MLSKRGTRRGAGPPGLALLGLPTLLVALTGLVSAQRAAARAVPVLAVEPGSLAGRAGLRAGDTLRGWRRGPGGWANPLPAAGVFAAPSDFEVAVSEQAPRGPLTLIGERGGRSRAWSFAAGASPARFGVDVSPGLPEPGLESEAADRAFAEALAAPSEDRRLRARLLGEWGRRLDRRREWARAAACQREAAALLEPDPAAALARARALHDLAEVYRHSDDYGLAARFHAEALGVRSVQAPSSLDAAESWLGTARVLLEAGLGDPLPSIEVAADLARRIDPGSLPDSRILDYRGLVLEHAGDRAGAERDFQEAASIARRAGGGFEAGRAILHLAALVGRGGEHARMEDLLREALALFRPLPDDFLYRSNLAHALGQLAFLRAGQGDPEAAYDLAREAAEVHRRMNPGSLGYADALMAIGQSARILGRHDEARSAFEEALRLRQALTPEGIEVAHLLSMLGHLEVDAGTDPKRGEALLRQALRRFEEKMPGSLLVGNALLTLSEVAALRGKPGEAVELARRALRLRSELAPDSLPVAEALWALARWERALGRSAEAARDGCQAAAVFRHERGRLRGRTAAGFGLAFQYWRIVVDCVAARVELGRAEEGFELLEGERARTLLDLKAMRVLREAGEEAISPALREERERWDEEYDRLTARLATLGADAGAVRDLQRRLAEHQDRYDDLRRRIRESAPGAAQVAGPAAVDPGPFQLERARRALERGSVLLSYAVGEKETVLFVVRPDGEGKRPLTAFRLPIGEVELEREVSAFRRLVEDPGADLAALDRAERSLYRRILEPAERAIASARRLLLVPDGALHSLPFAALRRPDGRHLIEWKPLSFLPSVAFLPDVRLPPAPAPSRVAAFADPATDLAPLPAARREVESLRALFRHTSVFYGGEATEAVARSLGDPARGGFDLIHFAVHSLVDERYPLRSALVLGASPPGSPRPEDGRLEAREIEEEGRFEARLVTLSSCESGLGKELGGEGLVGLTQAFLIAGARSVLASLWSVPDASTADFMLAFYARLRRGEPAYVALRHAQMARLRAPGTERPAYWAAFALYGAGD